MFNSARKGLSFEEFLDESFKDAFCFVKGHENELNAIRSLSEVSESEIVTENLIKGCNLRVTQGEMKLQRVLSSINEIFALKSELFASPFKDVNNEPIPLVHTVTTAPDIKKLRKDRMEEMKKFKVFDKYKPQEIDLDSLSLTNESLNEVIPQNSEIFRSFAKLHQDMLSNKKYLFLVRFHHLLHRLCDLTDTEMATMEGKLDTIHRIVTDSFSYLNNEISHSKQTVGRMDINAETQLQDCIPALRFICYRLNAINHLKPLELQINSLLDTERYSIWSDFEKIKHIHVGPQKSTTLFRRIPLESQLMTHPLYHSGRARMMDELKVLRNQFLLGISLDNEENFYFEVSKFFLSENESLDALFKFFKGGIKLGNVQNIDIAAICAEASAIPSFSTIINRMNASETVEYKESTHSDAWRRIVDESPKETNNFKLKLVSDVGLTNYEETGGVLLINRIKTHHANSADLLDFDIIGGELRVPMDIFTATAGTSVDINTHIQSELAFLFNDDQDAVIRRLREKAQIDPIRGWNVYVHSLNHKTTHVENVLSLLNTEVPTNPLLCIYLLRHLKLRQIISKLLFFFNYLESVKHNIIVYLNAMETNTMEGMRLNTYVRVSANHIQLVRDDEGNFIVYDTAIKHWNKYLSFIVRIASHFVNSYSTNIDPAEVLVTLEKLERGVKLNSSQQEAFASIKDQLFMDVSDPDKYVFAKREPDYIGVLNDVLEAAFNFESAKIKRINSFMEMFNHSLFTKARLQLATHVLSMCEQAPKTDFSKNYFLNDWWIQIIEADMEATFFGDVIHRLIKEEKLFLKKMTPNLKELNFLHGLPEAITDTPLPLISLSPQSHKTELFTIFNNLDSILGLYDAICDQRDQFEKLIKPRTLHERSVLNCLVLENAIAAIPSEFSEDTLIFKQTDPFELNERLKYYLNKTPVNLLVDELIYPDYSRFPKLKQWQASLEKPRGKVSKEVQIYLNAITSVVLQHRFTTIQYRGQLSRTVYEMQATTLSIQTDGPTPFTSDFTFDGNSHAIDEFDDDYMITDPKLEVRLSTDHIHHLGIGLLVEKMCLTIYDIVTRYHCLFVDIYYLNYLQFFIDRAFLTEHVTTEAEMQRVDEEVIRIFRKKFLSVISRHFYSISKTKVNLRNAWLKRYQHVELTTDRLEELIFGFYSNFIDECKPMYLRRMLNTNLNRVRRLFDDFDSEVLHPLSITRPSYLKVFKPSEIDASFDPYADGNVDIDKSEHYFLQTTFVVKTSALLEVPSLNDVITLYQDVELQDRVKLLSINVQYFSLLADFFEAFMLGNPSFEPAIVSSTIGKLFANLLDMQDINTERIAVDELLQYFALQSELLFRFARMQIIHIRHNVIQSNSIPPLTENEKDQNTTKDRMQQIEYARCQVRLLDRICRIFHLSNYEELMELYQRLPMAYRMAMGAEHLSFELLLDEVSNEAGLMNPETEPIEFSKIALNYLDHYEALIGLVRMSAFFVLQRELEDAGERPFDSIDLLETLHLPLGDIFGTIMRIVVFDKMSIPESYITPSLDSEDEVDLPPVSVMEEALCHVFSWRPSHVLEKMPVTTYDKMGQLLLFMQANPLKFVRAVSYILLNMMHVNLLEHQHIYCQMVLSRVRQEFMMSQAQGRLPENIMLYKLSDDVYHKVLRYGKSMELAKESDDVVRDLLMRSDLMRDLFSSLLQCGTLDYDPLGQSDDLHFIISCPKMVETLKHFTVAFYGHQLTSVDTMRSDMKNLEGMFTTFLEGTLNRIKQLEYDISAMNDSVERRIQHESVDRSYTALFEVSRLEGQIGIMEANAHSLVEKTELKMQKKYDSTIRDLIGKINSLKGSYQTFQTQMGKNVFEKLYEIKMNTLNSVSKRLAEENILTNIKEKNDIQLRLEEKVHSLTKQVIDLETRQVNEKMVQDLTLKGDENDRELERRSLLIEKSELEQSVSFYEQLLKRREIVLKNRISTLQQQVDMLQGKLTVVERDLQVKEKGKLALLQWKVSRERKLQELEDKLEKFARLDKLDIDKLLLELKAKDAALQKLRDREKNSESHTVDEVSRYKRKVASLEKQLAKEKRSKKALLKRIERDRELLPNLEDNFFDGSPPPSSKLGSARPKSRTSFTSSRPGSQSRPRSSKRTRRFEDLQLNLSSFSNNTSPLTSPKFTDTAHSDIQLLLASRKSEIPDSPRGPAATEQYYEYFSESK
ncbi:hypothetical protein PCE1_004232 [Barthelona sp. PCE]